VTAGRYAFYPHCAACWYLDDGDHWAVRQAGRDDVRHYPATAVLGLLVTGGWLLFGCAGRWRLACLGLLYLRQACHSALRPGLLRALITSSVCPLTPAPSVYDLTQPATRLCGYLLFGIWSAFGG